MEHNFFSCPFKKFGIVKNIPNILKKLTEDKIFIITKYNNLSNEILKALSLKYYQMERYQLISFDDFEDMILKFKTILSGLPFPKEIFYKIKVLNLTKHMIDDENCFDKLIEIKNLKN